MATRRGRRDPDVFPISFDLYSQGRLISRHSVRSPSEERKVIKATRRVYPAVTQRNRRVGGGRDVSRYDLSPAARAWMRIYREEGATPDVRKSFERLSRFDQAAIRFLLTENGR